ncbi:DUF3742 family protein [Pseudomonas benzopyrenica]|uniref:DUF3742 family protein n=1 Tax=Pseudomonas benzopyrenica TaxID=2993566 RepID=A0ABZ2FLR0_9PSED
MSINSPSTASRLGQGLGRAVSVVLRIEARFWNALGRVGIPKAIFRLLMWLVRLAAVVVLLAWSAGVVVPVIGLLAIAYYLSRSTSGEASLEGSGSSAIGSQFETEEGYQTGLQGFGYYDANGLKQHD